MRKTIFPILAILAIVLASTLASATSFYDSHTDRKVTFPHQVSYQPRLYFTDYYSTPTFTSYYKQPYISERSSSSSNFQDKSNSAFSNKDSSSFNRNYKDTLNSNTQNSYSTSSGFNNRNFANLRELGSVNQQNSYSASKGPCQTYTYHANFDGKSRDYKITETICDNIQYKQNDNTNIIYTIDNSQGYDERDFGRTSQQDTHTETRSFADIFTDRSSTDNSNTGSASYNNQRSSSQSSSYFDWLWNF